MKFSSVLLLLFSGAVAMSIDLSNARAQDAASLEEAHKGSGAGPVVMVPGKPKHDCYNVTDDELEHPTSSSSEGPAPRVKWTRAEVSVPISGGSLV